jgi:hypothetical protein
MAWDGPVANALDGFVHSFDPNQVADFGKIYALLTDELEFRKAAATFQLRTANAANSDQYRETLANLEAEFGFEAAVAFNSTAAEYFLNQVMSGKRIDDIIQGSLGNQGHGRSSHRVQWMIIALWNDASKSLTNAPHTLYRAIGKNRFRLNGKHIWDVLLDSMDIKNATCPEFLDDVMFALGTYFKT